MKTRPCLINISLVFSALIFVFGVIEVYLRIINYNPFGEFFGDEGRAIFIQPSQNQQRIYEAKPNALGYGWETDISINSHGFRGREYSVEKPAGTLRVAVIGDSITFGNRLPPDENYPAQLEKMYAQSGQAVEVLNLGLGGYDTLQEVATLNDIGLQFSPDVVVIGYCINDIGIASGNANYVKRLQTYGNAIYHLRTAQFIQVTLDRIALKQDNKELNQKEYFNEQYKNYMAGIKGDAVLDKLIEQLKNSLEASHQHQPFTWDYTDKNKIKRLRFAFEQLKALQDKNNFEVIVVLFPYLLESPEMQPSYKIITNMVSHEAERLQFNALDFYPLFLENGLSKLTIKADDGIHPNAKGHKLVAEALFHRISFTKK